MNFDHESKKILITGASGSGKTTLYLKLLKEWPCRWKFIFDPKQEVSRKLGYPISYDVASMNRRASVLATVCYDPTWMFPGRSDEGFAFFARWVLSVSSALNGPKLLAVDELQDFTGNGRKDPPQAFREVLDVGRREEIDLLIISQRPNELHYAIRSQLSECYTFLHVDRLQHEFLEYHGFNCEEVRRLKYPGGFIYRNLRLQKPAPNEPAAPLPKGKGNSLPADPRPKTRRHRG